MKLIKELLPYVIILLVVALVRTFLVTPVRVNGDSMNDTLYNGDIMILKKYAKNDLKRFDVVVINYHNEKLIKRIIGMPKEDIEYKDNILYINDMPIGDNHGNSVTADFKDYCAQDEYFVLGDNRGNSIDSRRIGCISKDDIIGKTNLVIFPFSHMGNIDKEN